MTNYLTQVEALLQPNVGLRVNAKIYYPQRFNLDGTNDLKEAAETALAEDRFAKKMAYYMDQYRSEPEQVRLKELAMCYAPLLLLEKDERKDRVDMQIYDRNDYVKADNAELALAKISASGTNLMETDDLVVFDLIDEYLKSRGLLREVIQPTPLV
jgi:hypothetical protein